MSESRLQVFADAAETRVPMPDLRELESRGSDLRRTRRATSAVVAAAALVVGGVAVAVSADGGGSARPAVVPIPSPSILGAEELPSRPSENERLLQGVHYTVRPTRGLFERGVRAVFTGQGKDWVWFGDGAIRTASGLSALDAAGGDVPGEIPRVPYAEFGVMHADKVALGQCDQGDPDPWWGDLAKDPLEAAAQVAAVPGVTQLGPPEVDNRFGHLAAHVQISVPRICPGLNDSVLWSLHPYTNGGHPGVGAVLYSGQVLDVWVVNVEGALVIVYVERSPGLPVEFGDEALAFVGSMRLVPVVGRD